ncbi:hypothetical protein HN371_06570 [Candidatus Poribacteria bacterium]|jgi:hypothetical protein|nr:hypothetical protein [Candidatus Poribacteria bacterium]MBT5711396.1 hypothetical protein [Candidatus Poribacteria bacterium]MBT7099419.1 hypothetical protein [Candidatus Poribacteria bacterium]MBT7804281.1 hypothetical protein [Candidatus Poribacteria bacterium]
MQLASRWSVTVSLLGALACLLATSSAFAAWSVGISFTSTPTPYVQPGETVAVIGTLSLTSDDVADTAATSIDLDHLVFPSSVDANSDGVVTDDVAVALVAGGADWSYTVGSSALGDDALDIALARGAGTAIPPNAATDILTLTYTIPYGPTSDLPAGEHLFDSGGGGGTVTPQSSSVNETPIVDPGAFHVSLLSSGIVQGDVTGNGDITAADAQQTLDLVSVADISVPSLVSGLGVQTSVPWGGTGTLTGRLLASGATINHDPVVPLNQFSAYAVADVDEDGSIEGAATGLVGVTALDAAYMLQFAVGIITTFPGSGYIDPAPARIAGNPSKLFRVAATSARPGAQVTLSLDLADIADLYAGTLRIDYDHAALRPVDVRIESSSAPLIAHSARSGDLGIAFASATPIEDGVVYAVFEAAPGADGVVPARIRARQLILNRTRTENAFEHRFLIEPYRFQLMANYPNPFNPETWIPFELAEDADVTIRIYGVGGARVRTLDLGSRPQGIYASQNQAAYWDGSNDRGERVASGVYVYEIAAGDYHATRRMVIMK